MISCCPTKVIRTTETVVKDSLVYRDSLIYVDLPGDTVHDSLEVIITLPGELKPIPSHLLNSDTLILKSILATSYSWLRNGYLNGKIEDIDSTLQFQLDSAIVEIYRLTNKTTTITETNLKYKDKLRNYKTAFWTALGVLVVLFLLVILLFRAKLK